MGAQPAGDDRAKGKGNHETWRDWMRSGATEPGLLTRSELLDALHARGIDAENSDLRFWEYEGVLPRPVRQWHHGAVRAVYPDWFVYLIAQLRGMQRAGFTLQEIAPKLRELAELAGSSFGPPGERELQSPDWLDSLGRLPPPDSLLPALATLARENERTPSRRGSIRRAEVRLVDDRGKEITYLFAVAPSESNQSG